MIDTHAHIYADQFDEDRDLMIQRARSAGINKIFLPNIDLNSIDKMFDLVHRYPEFAYPMLGLHPCSVQSDYKDVLNQIEGKLEQHKVIAIGEIGIDLYWDKSTKGIQEEAFVEQCGWAMERSLPIVIHSRESIDLILDIIESSFKGKLRGVFHCFTGDLKQAKRIMDLGMYMGIGGVLTFKNSDLKDVIPQIPLDRLLLETDSPYLAPVPYRGKRNEPAYMAEVLHYLAKMLNVEGREIDQQLEQNSLRLFKI